MRRNTTFNPGKRFPTYKQEYDSVTTVPGDIMAINMRIFRRNEIYANVAVSDTDTMYFNQATKENYATQFLKA